MTGGPRQVQQACESALATLAGAFTESATVGSREEWAAAIATSQRVIDVVSAAQDAAIARLAAIEPELLEDGTEVESHRALGHMALDAPAILSGVLAVSAVHAERRVRTAVRLAADGPAGADTETGLGGLHAAMRAGRLDAYRAMVVAHELEEAPPEVAATVVAALGAHFAEEDGAHLRRRCRRVLERLSPDLLLERATRARAQSGLRRWVDEPGVDRWEGTFPAEDAAPAWAAIDALARRYVHEQTCATVERARAKALTDLVAGNATIETELTLTVPATVLPDAGRDAAALPDRSEVTYGDLGQDDLVGVTGLLGSQPVLVSRQWLTVTVDDRRTTGPATVATVACHPVTGALLDDDGPVGPSAAVEGLRSTAAAFGAVGYRPSTRLSQRIRARDRTCRFPGCTVAAVFCDLDHVRPWPAGPTAAVNLMCLCRRHHRMKQRPGWRVVLCADGSVTWTDPTGRVRTTIPVDALNATVLRGVASRAPGSSSGARHVLPDGPHSDLEFHLEHLVAAEPRAPTRAWRDPRGRHRVEVVPHGGDLLLDRSTFHRACRPGRPPENRHDAEPPPF